MLIRRSRDAKSKTLSQNSLKQEALETVHVPEFITQTSAEGKETTDAIFTVRQTHENFRAKGKKLYVGFMDLEKAFDRVPRSDTRGNA